MVGMASEEMRAADADRQQVAERLRAALDEGRLDLSEYDDRLQRAYSAKTYGELQLLTTDLPVPAIRQSAPPRPVDADVRRRWLIHIWDEYVTAVAICVAIWVISGISGDGGFGHFWPVWVAGPWGLLLIWRTVTGLAQGEPEKWQAKNELKKARKERKELSE